MLAIALLGNLSNTKGKSIIININNTFCILLFMFYQIFIPLPKHATAPAAKATCPHKGTAITGATKALTARAVPVAPNTAQAPSKKSPPIR